MSLCRLAGTEKVRQAQGCKHLHVVNPDWLWSCLERWERVEEQLYPLKEDYSRTPRYRNHVLTGQKNLLEAKMGKPKHAIKIPISSPEGATAQPLFPTVRATCRKLFSSQLPSTPDLEARLQRYGPMTLSQESSSAGALRWGVQQPTSSRQEPTLIAGSSLVSGCFHHNSPISGHLPTVSYFCLFLCLREAAQSQQNEASGSSRDDEQPGPSRRKRQLSMSETMPLYTLCKEDLDSMDKEVRIGGQLHCHLQPS
ncbi:hypothetical protein XENOCAPTIV_010713 [Xenoophorus captivus]|uniref:protein-serine/threonine phosphatase n=1 Tax=Xenoophorus captivus TaxID=1517983 RepID=A0ABV0Q462_9TELE